MLNDPKQTPHILARGIITPDEAEKLFKMCEFRSIIIKCHS